MRATIAVFAILFLVAVMAVPTKYKSKGKQDHCDDSKGKNDDYHDSKGKNNDSDDCDDSKGKNNDSDDCDDSKGKNNDYDDSKGKNNDYDDSKGKDITIHNTSKSGCGSNNQGNKSNNGGLMHGMMGKLGLA